MQINCIKKRCNRTFGEIAKQGGILEDTTSHQSYGQKRKLGICGKFPQILEIRTLYKVRKRNCKMVMDRRLVDWRDWVKVISRTREAVVKRVHEILKSSI